MLYYEALHDRFPSTLSGNGILAGYPLDDGSIAAYEAMRKIHNCIRHQDVNNMANKVANWED